tara:strand:- start:49 stop:165 length:117 start_codon:yes stop_codon:yes gene_type:complete
MENLKEKILKIKRQSDLDRLRIKKHKIEREIRKIKKTF